MSTITVFSAIAIGVLALAGVLFPLFRRQRDDKNALDQQREHDELLTTYERVLATIRDLDDDYRNGKLADEIYQQERAYWTEQGIALLQFLEPDSDNDNETSLDSGQTGSNQPHTSKRGGIEHAAIPVF